MNYKGNLIFVTGVPGTSVDTDRNKAAHAVFAKYPDIKIIAEPNGMWSGPVLKKSITEVMATHSWSEVQGVWGYACSVIWQMEAAAGEKTLAPCGTDGSNSMRVMMLPKDAVKGYGGGFDPAGAPGISLESHPGSGAYALKLALDVIAGKTVPKLTYMPLDAVTTENVRLCKTGSYEELKGGCNTFDPSVAPGEWISVVYNPATPEIGLPAALTGQPEAAHQQ
jgi:ribose transport system substrate-binding protein